MPISGCITSFSLHLSRSTTYTTAADPRHRSTAYTTAADPRHAVLPTPQLTADTVVLPVQQLRTPDTAVSTDYTTAADNTDTAVLPTPQLRTPDTAVSLEVLRDHLVYINNIYVIEL